jgi:hypothetical protein
MAGQCFWGAQVSINRLKDFAVRRMFIFFSPPRRSHHSTISFFMLEDIHFRCFTHLKSTRVARDFRCFTTVPAVYNSFPAQKQAFLLLLESGRSEVFDSPIIGQG